MNKYFTKLNGYNAVATTYENEVQTILYVEVIPCEEVRNDLSEEIISKDDLTYSDIRSRDYSYEEMMEDYGEEYEQADGDFNIVFNALASL